MLHIALMTAKEEISYVWFCFWCLQPLRNGVGKLVAEKQFKVDLAPKEWRDQILAKCCPFLPLPLCSLPKVVWLYWHLAAVLPPSNISIPHHYLPFLHLANIHSWWWGEVFGEKKSKVRPLWLKVVWKIIKLSKHLWVHFNWLECLAIHSSEIW